MREIKFKGWCEKDSEWRYGFYITDGKVHEINTMLKSGSFYASQVDVESVGQYTGLKDKNGTEIYEGDIVKAFSVFDMTYDYSFEKDNDPKTLYQISFDDGCFQFKGVKQWSDGSNDWRSIENVELFKVEVIGNIYENPELIK